MNYAISSKQGEVWYFEVDEAYTAYRQLILSENKGYMASNRKDRGYGFVLSDQAVIYHNSPYVQIKKEEFEMVWSQYLEILENEWGKIKSIFFIGEEVDGFIEVFYPQGIIVTLHHYDAVAVVDYEQCST